MGDLFYWLLTQNQIKCDYIIQNYQAELKKILFSILRHITYCQNIKLFRCC